MTFRLGELASVEGAWPCWRKERWPSRGAAEAQLRSILRRGKAKDVRRINVYECPHCRLFHVGHRLKEKP